MLFPNFLDLKGAFCVSSTQFRGKNVITISDYNKIWQACWVSKLVSKILPSSVCQFPKFHTFHCSESPKNLKSGPN